MEAEVALVNEGNLLLRGYRIEVDEVFRAPR